MGNGVRAYPAPPKRRTDRVTTETQRLPTVEAYAAWTDPEDDSVTELVEGRIVREPRPGAPHARVQFELARRLGNWMRERGSGEVLGESGFILSEDPPTVRGPDVAVLLERRTSDDEPGGWIRGAPDVAVEVLSPSDTSTNVHRKTLEYLSAGAVRVWIVDPEAHAVTVYRADGAATLLQEGDTLEDPEVLPGFSLPLEDLFGP